MMMPTRKLIRPTIGSTIAPHCCISTTRSPHRNCARPRVNRPTLKKQSPSSCAKFLHSRHSPKLAAPTSENRLGKPAAGPGGFSGFCASKSASLSAPCGNPASANAAPCASLHARASRKNNASELSQLPSSSASTRTLAGDCPGTNPLQRGRTAASRQSPPTRTTRVLPSKEATARAGGGRAVMASHFHRFAMHSREKFSGKVSRISFSRVHPGRRSCPYAISHCPLRP